MKRDLSKPKRKVAPWRHTSRDRKWTARVERAVARGQYTEPKAK